MTPKNRRPVHPGEILLTEILEPMNMTQVELAERLAIPIQRINTIIRGKRGISAETAILLSQELGTTPEFWMNLQVAWDLYEARQRLQKAA
ncbi:MAG TPA: addiction module antidote protein, HigA family [Bacteroidetes bacterium]|nr:addiction module antidote protein, HigA family [Bacteroidota bacterium]